MEKIITWYGGKALLSKKILSMFPEHRIYCEVFGGAAHVLINKEPGQIDIYNDLNSNLVNLFKILRNEKEELIRLLRLTPYSREEFYYCSDNIDNFEGIEKARMFYVKTMQSFANCGNSWSFDIKTNRGGKAAAVNKFINNIVNLKFAAEKLRNVQIENLDFRKCIEKYDTKDTLFYLDPPYIPDTRKRKKIYQCEMTLKDHCELIEILKNIKGKFLLSGFDNEIYNVFDKQLLKRLPNRSGKNYMNEYIWRNF